MAKQRKITTIYVDGSCIGNPGPGGYGGVIDSGRRVRKFSGGRSMTTNNQMELLAAIRALERTSPGSQIRIYTDSQYVQRGITEWVHGWIARGWRTAAGSPVQNKDLWQRLIAAAARHDVSWQWVRGHNGDPGNEQAHILAETAARKRR